RGRAAATAIDALWVPVVSALLIVLAGAMGFWMSQPWLFAGLGPTVLMIVSNPGHETTSFRAVVVGHLAAIACAYLAVLMLSANEAATLTSSTSALSPRVLASAAAIAMLALVQPQLRAYHPPAAATALLITLGAYRMTGKTPIALMCGVVVVVVGAEILRRLRPRQRR
ncbi:MAG TPA: HPP family protein, partial [Gemmatimonadaceae bacterium]|nr:HPP family protein [Gemmatimonadaceae bacterium]